MTGYTMQLTHATKIQTETIDGKDISYILKANRKDIAHLVVVFNDYRHGGWSFGNAVNFFKCNVLLIADIFDGRQSCYTGSDGNLDFAPIVAQLIEKILSRLNLTKVDCTLLGASKGGYAALYVGVRYGFGNIVSSAPFGHLGSWMVNHDQDIAQHVMGKGYTLEQVQYYDKMLNRAILEDENRQKNIYFFVSFHDYFYLEYGQKELLKDLKENYPNFNAIFTNSNLAFQHNQVTAYFTQEILSIVNLLSNKIVPKLNQSVIDDMTFDQAIMLPDVVSNDAIFGRKGQIDLSERPINNISTLRMQDHKLHIEGEMYIQNFNAPNYRFLNKKLCLHNLASGKQHVYPLGSVPKGENSRELYQNIYFDYSASGVATMGHNGIDLSDLDYGVYQLRVSVTKQEGGGDWQNISLTKPLDVKNICQDAEYHLGQRDGNIVLIKRSIIGVLDQERHFALTDSWCKGSNFHLEGEFVVWGATMPSFYMGHYYLVARHKEKGVYYSSVLGQVRSKDLCKRLGDLYENYLACYFATMHFQGIDTTQWEYGEYELFVSLSHHYEIFSKMLNLKLVVTPDGCSLS